MGPHNRLWLHPPQESFQKAALPPSLAFQVTPLSDSWERREASRLVLRFTGPSVLFSPGCSHCPGAQGGSGLPDLPWCRPKPGTAPTQRVQARGARGVEWARTHARTGVAGVGQPWGGAWAPLGVATGQCGEWVWVEAGYPRSEPGWSKREMFTFQGVLNSLTVHPTQLLPQLPCPAGCTPAPPPSPSTMLTPLPFASMTPTQPAIP